MFRIILKLVILPFYLVGCLFSWLAITIKEAWEWIDEDII